MEGFICRSGAQERTERINLQNSTTPLLLWEPLSFFHKHDTDQIRDGALIFADRLSLTIRS